MQLIKTSVSILSRRHCSSNNSTPDAISIFTDHIIHSRLEKHLDSDVELSGNNYNILLKLNMNENEIELLDTIKKYLQKYIKREDVPAKPPIKLLDSLAYYFIHRNDLEGLQLIISVHKLDYAEFVKQGEYTHYLIDYHSRNNQLDKSFEIINDYYSRHKQIHYLMKFSIRALIKNVVDNRSEAVLVNLLNHVKIFSTLTKDYYPLLILWKTLFTSEWYTDQTEAKYLFLNYPTLQLYVSIICVNFALELLSKKNVQAVESLLEYFLRLKNESGEENKYEKQCMLLLRALFDYQCVTHNLRACTEIVKTSFELNLPLSEDQKVQFFNVLLKKPIQKKFMSPIHKPIYPLKF